MAGARTTPVAANARPGARPTAPPWSPPPASHHVMEIGRRIAPRLSALGAWFPHRHASDGDASNPAGDAIGEATQRRTPVRESCYRCRQCQLPLVARVIRAFGSARHSFMLTSQWVGPALPPGFFTPTLQLPSGNGGMIMNRKSLDEFANSGGSCFAYAGKLASRIRTNGIALARIRPSSQFCPR